MKVKEILFVMFSIIIVTSSAFMLAESNNSAGADITVGEFTYEEHWLDLDGIPTNREVILKGYSPVVSVDRIVIPDKITVGADEYLVTIIGKNVFINKAHIVEVIMGENVRFIDDWAFAYTGINELHLRNVTSVGSYTFYGCTALTLLSANYLEKIGDYAFAIPNTYTGTIPYMANLNLPNVKTIGACAFGDMYSSPTSNFARKFGTINLPNVETIGDYAFRGSTMTSLNISNAITIGRYAFYLDAATPSISLPELELTMTKVTSIGDRAFTGRPIVEVTLPSTLPYTIGANAFQSTSLRHANLGMVSSIGSSAFDGTEFLQYFQVSASNANYASLISDNIANVGVKGALYEAVGGVPVKLIRLPPAINNRYSDPLGSNLLADLDNKFIVADGVKEMERSACVGCPAISVDLNEIEVIPSSAFANSRVTSVTAKNAHTIQYSAFAGCGVLESFDFLDAGGPLSIGDYAFQGTALKEILLPKQTTVGMQAFVDCGDVEILGIWGDTVIASNSFFDVKIDSLMVSSDDAVTTSGAEALYQGWNASGWKYGGSKKVQTLMVDNHSPINIEWLVPIVGTSGQLQIMHSFATLGVGSGPTALQFVEHKYRPSALPPLDFHMVSVKPGIYEVERDGSVGSPIPVADNINNNSWTLYNDCYRGDGVTWELRYEYYEIVFHMFDPDKDGVNGPDADDPLFIDSDITDSLLVSLRTVEIERGYYLANTILKTLPHPTYYRYDLAGWYIGDDPDHGVATDIKYEVLAPWKNVILQSSQFGVDIDEEWIIRDSVTDFGTLHVYAVFSGKQYIIEVEARLTGGQYSTVDDLVANPAGGKVVLTPDTPYIGFSTDNPGTPGKGSESYPYGTGIMLEAIPNPGYVFVGWGVVDLEAHTPLMGLKNDRSYVQSGNPAYWSFSLPQRMMYVAYFAKVIEVTFDYNDGTLPVVRDYVIGDKLIEANNDYNSHDYDKVLAHDTESAPYIGKGSADDYPGTPSISGLTFGGWYAGTTLYYDGTDPASLAPMPNLANLTLKAKWYATITLHTYDGYDAAHHYASMNLLGTGVTQVTAGEEYQYKVDVGDFTLSGYSTIFKYGGADGYEPIPFDDVSFNGWYELIGPPAVSNIVTVASGTNAYSALYPDIYDTYKRIDPAGIHVNGDMSLMALYKVTVDFYFNADNVDPTHIPGGAHTYRVYAPVSILSTTLGSLSGYTVNVVPAITSAMTYKLDDHPTTPALMTFMGWYVSADGSTLPTALDTIYSATTPITENVKLIAGWGVKVEFNNGGLTIYYNTTTTPWVPSDYEFTVLEGTVFELNYNLGNPKTSPNPGMPDIWNTASNTPTAWYYNGVSPNVWFMDGSSTYTYSVVLIPGFNPLFKFDMMGGTPTAVFVECNPTDTFAMVLDKFFLAIKSGATYLDLEKPGLYYEENPLNVSAAHVGAPKAAWYKDWDGNPITRPDFVNDLPLLDQWDMTEMIGGQEAQAYIRWLAEVKFYVDDPSPPYYLTSIMDVDEGTPFDTLTPPGFPLATPHYNASDDKTFKGWEIKTTHVKYAGQDGYAVVSTPVTGNMTLTAMWGVEVTFYFTGAVYPLLLPPGTVVHSDLTGTYVVIDVNPSTNKVITTPSLNKGGFSLDNNLLWYEGGFNDTNAAPYVNSVVPSATDPSSFSITGGRPTTFFNPISDDVLVNKTVFSRWYAVVTFDSRGAAGWTTPFLLLEGSKLSDFAPILPLMATPMNIDPYLGEPGWEFIGWYDQTSPSLPLPLPYDNLGYQYYGTVFGNTVLGYDDDILSNEILRDVTLKCEHVVLVNFDPNFAGATAIPPKYLRTNVPLPDSGSARFTGVPFRGVGAPTFMGWFDVANVKYTEDVRNSAEPNATKVTKPMTLKAAWLVTVQIYQLSLCNSLGLTLAVDGSKIVQCAGIDLILGTDDDYFEMPEGTTIRQFITADPVSPGKTFVSWFEEKTLPCDGIFVAGDIVYGLTTPIVYDVTLSAGYGFIMSFDTNGGTPSSMLNILVIEGQSFYLPEKPARDRLTFRYWEDNDPLSSGTTTKSMAGALYAPAANTHFTAKWLVHVILYDGISMNPWLDMEWDVDVGPSLVYTTISDAAYGGNVTKVQITYTDPLGITHPLKELEKYFDRYDFSISGWEKYSSIFNGWTDPFNGTTLAPTDDLNDLFNGVLGISADSTALFPLWKERVRFYDGSGALGTYYVDTGEYLGLMSSTIPGHLATDLWADLFSPDMPLNPATYRIRDSEDFVAVDIIKATFLGGGGTPALQVADIPSGTMLGAIPITEPTRGGQFFAGWYDGTTRYSYTDRLFSDITLTAKWQSTPVERYTIFAVADLNSYITPKGMVRCMAGDTVSFDFYVAKGYTAVLVIDGMEVYNTTGHYTFSNVRGDHSIEIKATDKLAPATTVFLTVNVSGKGDVMYSTNGGTVFVSYTEPLPLYAGAEYLLKAVPKGSSYFINWTGDASGSDPQVEITSDGTAGKTVTAHFGSSSGFGIGSLGIANLICMILSFVIGIVALAVAYKRNYEGTGTGKALRFGALFVALISMALFFLTEGFGGTYIMWDEWSPVMVLLAAATIILALLSVRYDFLEADDHPKE